MRDWNGTCHRCHQETNGHIMSMFNEQLICFDCSDKERKRDDFKAARKADEDAIRRGNFNFKGIGLGGGR